MFDLWRELRSTPVTTRIVSTNLRRLRLALAVLWMLSLAAWIEVLGPPLSLKHLLLWLSLAMLVASVGNPLGWAKSMLTDWFPLYLMLVSYKIAWGLVDNLGIRPHVDPHLSFDQVLFGAETATYHLQEWLWDGGPAHKYDYVFLIVYLSHFVVTLVVCAGLWMRSRTLFLSYRSRVMGTWFLALAVFATYPSVPPWMAAEQGHLPEMTRIIGRLMNIVASSQASRAVADGGGKIAIENPVAAVPSMHAALPMLLLLFVWNRARALRAVLVLYAGLMGFVLIYAGEHYLFDILAGWACAAVVHVTLGWRERRRAETTLSRTNLQTRGHSVDDFPSELVAR